MNLYKRRQYSFKRIELESFFTIDKIVDFKK